ncbi:MAG TPA: alpha/beta hydrolase [Candidatus Paceibacterota bacterium]|nr:alpha/beta hydrolase [Candidatus Paceibacterota bacterium]
MEKDMVKRWFLRIALGMLGTVAIAIAGGLVFREVVQHRIASESRMAGAHGISSLEEVVLGGRPQSILIRAEDTRHPVLLFLHGGPGGPLMYEARLFGRELEKHFVVVHWDQRGAGKSYRSDIEPAEMTIAQFKSDAVELIQLLRRRFGVDRVYLVGHSWGTILGALVAHEHPELLWAYVGAAQVVDIKRNEEISYVTAVSLARRAGNQQALRELARIKPPYDSIQELKVERQWLWHFLAEEQGNESAASTDKALLRLLESPEYSLLDVWRTLKGLFWTLEVMWDELKTVDLVRQVPRIDVPVYLFLGRHDRQVPAELAEAWLADLQAPRKEIIWFEHSAHDMYLDEPQRFQEVLIEKLLDGTASPAMRE